MIRSSSRSHDVLKLGRSWTGRSALSHATDSALPRLVVASTFRTRVSDLRDVAPGSARAISNSRSAEGLSFPG
jgi:hypothetical protein